MTAPGSEGAATPPTSIFALSPPPSPNQFQGRLLGVILTAGGIAEVAAPWFVGRLRDATGSYSASCFALVGIALLGGFAVLGLPERKRAL
jgi:cyanate permease